MNGKKSFLNSAKECAQIAVFVALVIAAQLAFSFIAGVELVTVLFVCFAFIMGCGRGMVAATTFSLLRQMVFSADPKVFVLYIVYYNFLTLVFGLLGKKIKRDGKNILLITAVACLCTVLFTMFDNGLTALWLGFSAREAKLYFYASLPVVIPQTICTAATVGGLFLPLTKVFALLKRGSMY